MALMEGGADLGPFAAVLAAWLGAAWFVGAVAFFGLTCAGTLIQPLLQRRRATHAAQPPVSAILPIKLDNPGFAEAEASVFGQHYPVYEVLFGASDAVPQVVEVVEAIMRAHQDVPAQILDAPCDRAVSPKLNTLAAPLAAAQHDFILTKDSNIVFSPDTMAAFMQNFSAGVGLVVGVPIAERPATLAGHIEAFLLNGHARLLLTASALGVGFGVGKVMLFKRSDLARAGGIDAMGYTIAEDTAISRGLAAIGLKTVFAHQTLRQVIGWRSLREIYDRQLRWAVIRRAHEPVTFPLEPFSSPLPAAFAAAFAAPLVGVAALNAFACTLFVWFCCEIAIAWVKGWEVSAVTPLAFIGRELLALSTWLRAWTTKDVTWANGRFGVFDGAQSGAALSLEGRNAEKS